MFTSFTTDPYKSQKKWVLVGKYITFLSTKTNQTNRRETTYPSNSSPTRSSWAEIQYFEESSPLICVDRTPHDPPACSLGETNPHDPKRTPYLKGPGPWKYVPAAAKQRGCLPISLYLLLSITQIHAQSLMKTCWSNVCKGKTNNSLMKI